MLPTISMPFRRTIQIIALSVVFCVSISVSHPSTTLAADLPDRVMEMRKLILDAARTGKIEELREAYEWNELPPTISKDPVDDPVAHWKKTSVDSKGLEILVRLSELLSAPPAIRKQSTGKPVYVWPKVVDVPFAKLPSAQRIAVLTGMPRDQIKAVTSGKTYKGYTIVIGHDGTWHSFLNE